MTQAYFNGALTISIVAFVIAILALILDPIVKRLTFIREDTRDNIRVGLEMAGGMGIFIFVCVFWTTFLD